MINNLNKYSNLFSQYSELRSQSNKNVQLTLLNGDVTINNTSYVSGISCRANNNGFWGFSSSSNFDEESVKNVIKKANENAKILGKSIIKPHKEFEVFSGNMVKDYSTKQNRLSQKELLDFSKEIDNYIAKKYPKLISRIVNIKNLEIEKNLITSQGASSYLLIPRGLIYITLTMENNGVPTELYESYGGFGSFEDNFTTPEELYSKIDKLYEDVARKNEGIYAEAGVKECVIDSNLTGLMAHEAIGHTTEADLVLRGSVAGDNVGKRVASDLVTLIDYANTMDGELCPVPQFIDDEGVTCRDATLIEKGILKEFMHDRETSQKFNTVPTGNARALYYYDEPTIRMRNTAIVPGKSKVEDMISSVEDGYYLCRCSNGQADSTSEFMFGVVMGYEIKNGKIGRAIKDTTISGIAFDVLQTVSMVSDTVDWIPGGVCFKKQMNIVGMGGPAIKCNVTVGGK